MQKAGLISGPQVARIFQASWERRGKQQKEQDSPYLGPSFQHTPVISSSYPEGARMQVKLWVSLHSLYAKCIILEKSQHPSVPFKIMQPAKGLSFQRLRFYRLVLRSGTWYFFCRRVTQVWFRIRFPVSLICYLLWLYKSEEGVERGGGTWDVETSRI